MSALSVSPVVEAAFAALARIRSARAFHPRGALFAGRMELDGPGSPTVAVLGGTLAVTPYVLVRAIEELTGESVQEGNLT